MKLTYRGISYTLQTPSATTAFTVSTTATPVIGKYRGAAFQVQQANAPEPSHSHKLNLKYRGAYYYPVAYPSDWIFAPI